MRKIKYRLTFLVVVMIFILQCSTVFATSSKNIVLDDSLNVEENIELKVRAEITGNGVRIRKTASTSATVLGLLYKGDVVTVHRLFTNSSGNWAYITSSKGIVGYISATYVAL